MVHLIFFEFGFLIGFLRKIVAGYRGKKGPTWFFFNYYYFEQQR